jgi:hypothetical protein
VSKPSEDASFFIVNKVNVTKTIIVQMIVDLTVCIKLAKRFAAKACADDFGIATAIPVLLSIGFCFMLKPQFLFLQLPEIVIV